jgi:hypothetical protein
LYVDDTLSWARAIAAQRAKGNILEGIFFMPRPDIETRAILKGVCSATADILEPVELKIKGKKYTDAELTAYYVGSHWQKFSNAFDARADVRVARWAFDSTYKEEIYSDKLEWYDNSNGSSAFYKNMRLDVFLVAGGTWQVEIDGLVVADSLPDQAMAKTIAANTAEEQLSAVAA